VTVPEARKDPILRRYPLRRHRVSVAGGTLSIVAPRRSEDLLAAFRLGSGQPAPRELPYWADVWPASVALGRHLLRQGGVAGASVVDLGSGVGVAGAAASRAGAAVTCLDRDPNAVAFAAFNARHNRPAGVTVPEPEARVFDWSAEVLAPARFDIVLLADVTYHHGLHGGLARQLRVGLAPGGIALHADPGRPESGDFLQALAPDFAVATETIATSWNGERCAVRLALIRPA